MELCGDVSYGERMDIIALIDCTNEKLGDFGFGKAGQNNKRQVGFQMSRPTIGEENCSS